MAKAAAAIITGIKWLASSPAATELLKEGHSYLGMDVNEKLQDLQNIVIPEMEMLIEAAENSLHRDRLRGWLKSLEEAVYEAGYVLDWHEYYLLQQKAKSSACGITVRLESLPLIKHLSKSLSIVRQNIKLRKSLMKLEKAAAEAKEFLQFLPIGVSNVRRSEVTTSLLTHKVFGRNKQRDRIVGFLRETVRLESEFSFVKNYSVVAIVGPRGVGKTTLAQYVCSYEKEAKHFDVIMWVHVSRGILDVEKLTREMVESASREECPNLTNLDTLQRKLEDSLRSKKVLLVLDDVWRGKEATELLWEQLLAPLSVGDRGSKILMTTRMTGAAQALGARHILRLEELEERDFLSLFTYYALGDAEVDNNKPYEQLKEIVRQNAPKLHGSPLAARMVGSQLRRRPNVDVWKRILSEELLKDVASLYCGAIGT